MRKKSSSKSKDSARHSRKRRKSSPSASSSEGDSPKVEQKRSRSRKSDKDSAPETGRLTRSRRLAAASGSDTSQEVAEHTVPSNVEHKKKESPLSKSKEPAGNVWMVKSSNGQGSGELQKLKICIQRTPDIAQDDVKENSAQMEGGNSNSIGKESDKSSPEEDPCESPIIEYVSDIQLPEDDPPEICEHTCKMELAVSAEKESEKEDGIDDELSALVSEIHAKKSKEKEEDVEGKAGDLKGRETCLVEKLEAKKGDDVKVVDMKDDEKIEKIVEKIKIKQKIVGQKMDAKGVNAGKKVNDEEKGRGKRLEKEGSVSGGDGKKETLIENATKKVVEKSASELVSVTESSVAADNDEPVIELMVAEDYETMTGETAMIEEPKVAVLQTTTEEVYDYENDVPGKEEGEISGAEMDDMKSPIWAPFKKLPLEQRVRHWGQCISKQIPGSLVICHEDILRKHNVQKLEVKTQDIEREEQDDLIFVKEVRKENVVHELDDSFTEDEIKNSSSMLRRTARAREDGKNLSKTVLFVNHLVRPFTIPQLKDLLRRTGNIVDGGFWIDDIKSKCYVEYETEDEALETRHALHGTRWPVNNPKVLSVQFAAEGEMAQAMSQRAAMDRIEVAPAPPPPEPRRRVVERVRTMDDGTERVRKIRMMDVREWDVGKPEDLDKIVVIDDEMPVHEEPRIVKERTVLLNNDRAPHRKYDFASENGISGHWKRTIQQEQPQPQKKSLEDLFKKTLTTPGLYWKPLTEQQIAAKEEGRKKRRVERSADRGSDDRRRRPRR